MRRIIIATLVGAAIALTCTPQCEAQGAKKEVKFRNDYYNTRLSAHQREGLKSGAIIFIGNSITEQGWWKFLLGRDDIENRGIGGDNTFGMLFRLPEIAESQPSKIFLMAGINDLTAGHSVDTIVYNIGRMVEIVKSTAPKCKMHIQSVLPINNGALAYAAIKGKNPKVKELNGRLEELCRQQGIEFVNLAPLLSDANGELRLELTKDGIHLHPEAYKIWTDYLKKSKLIK